MSSRSYGVAPDKSWLERAVRRELTQQQMVDEWATESGHRMSRSAIAMAMARHEVESAHPRPRYEDMLPWRVKNEHRMDTDARLLRIHARICRGEEVTSDEVQWHAGWLSRLREAKAVVDYERNAGFHWVDRADGDSPEDVIRRPRKETPES